MKSLRIFAATVIAGLLGLSLFLVASRTGVFAQLVNTPETNVDPIVDGSMNSFSGEYAQATAIPGNGGTIYAQYRQNWNARSVQTGSQAVYPGTTVFELHNFTTATTVEVDDYNFFSHTYSNGTKISVWIFAGADDPDDSDWIGLSGLGYASIDDRGFLVRVNDNPATDVQWLPGMPEPGDPGWNWDTYHGVFASSYTRFGFVTNEVYEVAWHNTGNVPDEPPLPPCTITITVGVSDPKNGEPQLQVLVIWLGELHVGVPTPTPPPPPVCGNNIVENPPEQCDPPAQFSGQCPTQSGCQGQKWCKAVYAGECTGQCLCETPPDRFECSCVVDLCGAGCTKNADCPTQYICQGCVCVGPIGGIAESEDGAKSALESAESSTASSSLPYGAIAGIALTGGVLLATGGWYARRRWLR